MATARAFKLDVDHLVARVTEDSERDASENETNLERVAIVEPFQSAELNAVWPIKLLLIHALRNGAIQDANFLAEVWWATKQRAGRCVPGFPPDGDHQWGARQYSYVGPLDVATNTLRAAHPRPERFPIATADEPWHTGNMSTIEIDRYCAEHGWDKAVRRAAIDHGCNSWDVRIAHLYSVALISALDFRSGRLRRDGNSAGREPNVDDLVARVTLRFDEGQKNMPNVDRVAVVVPFPSTELNVVYPIAVATGHPGQEGNQGDCGQDTHPQDACSGHKDGHSRDSDRESGGRSAFALQPIVSAFEEKREPVRPP
ncbi:MAG: hypothetical protein M1826_003792 [Phylliscum demangeonii]|nr:MAG: hypothetical protein M1826_003792 [Phylliscum demangeonii]